MELDNSIKSHIIQIQEAARQNRLVIFVGAGVSASAGVPIWHELIEMFKKELPENLYDHNDILKSAQIYRELRGEVEYLKQIKKILKYGQSSCNLIHKAIMEFNPCHIITTNYDDLLEQSALQNNKQYYVVANDSHLPANQGERMLIKMHGDFKEGNIVLTENDYFDYSRNFPLIRSFLLSLFSTKVVLFVGFSFDDINLKYILREVSSILASKMQRVYMLVNENVSELAYSYFIKKGIQLLSIPLSISTDILKKQKIEYDYSEFSHDKSKALYQNLLLIKHYDLSKNDIIISAINFLKKYDEQIRFWGKYLEYILPNNQRSGFSISQYDLSLPYCYKEWFDQNIENSDANTLINRYGNSFEWLLEKLQINRILSVNKKSLFNESRLNLYNKKREKCALSIIYNLSIVDIIDRVKRLKKCPNKYSIEDLELPYILCKIGRYKESYLIYKQLAPEFWKRRKYILYFISLYNIKALHGKIYMFEYGKVDFDYSAFYEEINEIKLNEILDELPLDNSVKILMESLVNGKMLMEDWIESSRLYEQLYQQRINAEKGGVSINNNIIKLLDNFEQTFYFCNENYILNECYKDSVDTYKIMIKGMLNSIMTPNKEKYFQTKLDKLRPKDIPLLIFMVDSKELKQIFDSIVHKPIPVDDYFINSLCLLIYNLEENIKKNRNNHYVDTTIIVNCIKNTLLLLNRVENTTCVDGIYQILIHYWHKDAFVDFCSELKLLYDRKKPTPDEAIRILHCIVHTPRLEHYKNIENYILCMSLVAQKGGKYIEDIVDVRQLDYITNIRLKSAFSLVLKDTVRHEMITYIQSTIDNLYDLCIIELQTHLHIINTDLIRKLKPTINKSSNTYLWTEEVICNILFQFTLDDEYEDIHEIIKELSSENECYRFISDPLNYDKLENIKGTWLEQLTDDKLRKLIENSVVRKIAVNYSDDSIRNSDFKNRIWRLLK